MGLSRREKNKKLYLAPTKLKALALSNKGSLVGTGLDISAKVSARDETLPK